MDADWAGVAVTVVATLGAAVWAVWTWSRQREEDRQQERQRVNSLYVNPMLFATEDLQSRLFNLLDRGGLLPLRNRDPEGRYAIETVYLLARYFAWEQLILRFTHFAAQPAVVNRTQTIRSILASDSDGIDSWCLFRPTQTALGQAVTVWRQGEVGFADTIPYQDFERLVSAGLARDLGLEAAVQSLQRATTIEDLPVRSRRRLAELQSQLVSLLEELEGKLTTNAQAPFSVTGRRPRQRAAMANEVTAP